MVENAEYKAKQATVANRQVMMKRERDMLRQEDISAYKTECEVERRIQ